MTASICIGEGLALPLEWMSLATVVYGARGSGKTTLGTVLAEEVAKAGQRFCAIDLKGDWYGLKSSRDGNSEGIPVVVFGGDHADVPLEDGAGAFVGEVVASISHSVILDFEYFSKGRQIKFLKDFFLELYHRNREPLLLIADEAQRYAPQISRGDSVELMQCLGAVEDVVKLGRKHGLGVVLLTQRGSGLNKEVSELCDMLVAFRTPGPLDQKRVADWLDVNATEEQRKAVMGQLAGLPTGSAVFASGHPGLRLFGVYQVRERETFDSSATPKIGEVLEPPRAFADVDIEALRARISTTIERAKSEDPAELRRQVATLKAEIKQLNAKLQKAQVAPPKTVRVATMPLGATRALAHLRHLPGQINVLVADFERAFDGMGEAEAVKSEGNYSQNIPDPIPASVPQTPPQTRAENRNRTERDGSISGPQQKILNAIARLNGAGIAQPTRQNVAALAGYSWRGGRYSNLLGSLRTAGLLDYPSDGLLALTEAGRAAVGDVESICSLGELHEAWRGILPRSEAAVMDVLIQTYPRTVSREALADATGYSAGGGRFANLVGALHSFGVATYPTRGEVRASELLFPEGL